MSVLLLRGCYGCVAKARTFLAPLRRLPLLLPAASRSGGGGGGGERVEASDDDGVPSSSSSSSSPKTLAEMDAEDVLQIMESGSNDDDRSQSVG